ncbi:MAG: hypothetical protein ACOZF2_06650 [Thermodesulfobacteriota bacterium]
MKLITLPIIVKLTGEINLDGGQNVPADWHDLEENRQRQARTVPVVLGPKKASKTILATLAASVVLGINPFDQPNVQESKDNTKKLLHTELQSKRYYT